MMACRLSSSPWSLGGGEGRGEGRGEWGSAEAATEAAAEAKAEAEAEAAAEAAAEAETAAEAEAEADADGEGGLASRGARPAPILARPTAGKEMMTRTRGSKTIVNRVTR